MQNNGLNDKLIAVLGYGQEGRAVTKYLIKHGVKPVLFDQKSWEEWTDDDKTAIKSLGVNFIFGPDAFLELTGFDVIFRSPGIKASQFTTHNSQLTSQTKFFFDNCPAKIIGVTGTKGKGTTATLILEILKKQYQVYLTGNIGKEQALDLLDNLTPEDWVIYELSSFQLQDLTKSPHIGVVLMVTSEHLDYHRDNQEYIEAKSAITKFQNPDDIAVINKDFGNSLTIGQQGNGKKLYFSTAQAADCFVESGQIVTGDSNYKIPVSDLQLKGKHNWQNVCAAVLAAKAAGAQDEAIVEGVKSFRGLEHRLEFVAEKQNIKFYNDSFSTTPETAIAAIESFTEPLVVILGGSTKKSDFSRLGKAVEESKNIKSVILLGEEAPRIKESIGGGYRGKFFEGAANMDEVFKQIKGVAASGDVVLLSPACASFGMFKNYQDRGEKFKALVNSYN